jgi:hypothetical protein
MIYFRGKSKASLSKDEEFSESNNSETALAEMLG